MDDFWHIVLLTAALSLAIGCKNDTPENTTESGGTASTATVATQGESPASQSEAADVPQSAQAFIEAMQSQLDESSSPESIEKAIEIGKQGRREYPDDEYLVQALSSLMYKSVDFLRESPGKLNARRLELGEMARVFASKPDLIAELGNLPGFLLIEEAKSYAVNKNPSQAWETIQSARELGFEQPKLLYFEPEFENILGDTAYSEKVLSWLADELDEEIANHQPYAIDLKLKSLDDESLVSVQDLDKDLVLVDVWGTWCGPCRAAIPHLVELQNDADNVAVVGLTFEHPIGEATFEQAQKQVKEFQETQPMNYPCFYGDFSPEDKIKDFQGFPTMLLVDKQGKVRMTLTGYQPLPVLQTAIDRVLRD